MMKKETKKRISEIIYWCFITSAITFFVMGIIIGSESIKSFDKGYKQGQIDALNGIQNWDKIITKDTIYIKIK